MPTCFILSFTFLLLYGKILSIKESETMTKTDLWERLKNANKPILIYGMGDGCDKILRVCKEKGIQIQGIFASDEYARGQEVHGFPVTTFSQAKARFGDMIVLLAFGVFRDDLLSKILSVSRECELYAPEVPLFGGGLFDLEYYLRHQHLLEEVENMLGDETSKRVWKDVLEYKLTGDIRPLIRCQTEKREDHLSLIPYHKGDAYLDLGSYDGDTVLEWAELHPDHGPILAVEPNPKSFQKILLNTRGLEGISALEAAAWNREETLFFNGKSGRSAAVSPDGKASVRGMAVDEMGFDPDFIKYDVEGAEKEAIEGSARLLREKKPTLCISCYHRTEDIFAIPLQIKKIQPDYKVYLRHWQYIPAWDTVFYFVGR
jgi:FkbM family methyltransferase